MMTGRIFNTMRQQNRLDCFVPGNVNIVEGWKDPLFGYVSPGDLIVENINNACGSKFIGDDIIPNIPNQPFGGLRVKWFETRGAYNNNNKYIIGITNEGLCIEDNNGSELKRTIVRYPRNLKVCNISRFLREFLI